MVSCHVTRTERVETAVEKHKDQCGRIKHLRTDRNPTTIVAQEAGGASPNSLPAAVMAASKFLRAIGQASFISGTAQ